jgi:hypothetical protein
VLQVIEPLPLPAEYTADIQGCDWDGDDTFEGLARHVKRLQHCLESYQQRLAAIRRWDTEQRQALEKKKRELGLK